MSASLSIDIPTVCDLRNEIIPMLFSKAVPLLQKNNLVIQQKENEVSYDIVTDVDLKVQKIILEEVKNFSKIHIPTSLYNHTHFVGEENFKSLNKISEQLIWILDPIDGTLNFANSLPSYAISISLVADGIPVLGIVIDAVTGDVFDAIYNSGARLNHESLKWQLLDNFNVPMTLSTGTIRWLLDHQNHEILNNLFQMNGRLRLNGSQALQLCWAAAGRLAININREAKIWDDIAGALIAKEAGASYLRMDGKDIFHLQDDDEALKGGKVFSLCGAPDQVKKAQNLLSMVAGNFYS